MNVKLSFVQSTKDMLNVRLEFWAKNGEFSNDGLISVQTFY